MGSLTDQGEDRQPKKKSNVNHDLFGGRSRTISKRQRKTAPGKGGFRIDGEGIDGENQRQQNLGKGLLKISLLPMVEDQTFGSARGRVGRS